MAGKSGGLVRIPGPGYGRKFCLGPAWAVPGWDVEAACDRVVKLLLCKGSGGVPHIDSPQVRTGKGSADQVGLAQLGIGQVSFG